MTPRPAFDALAPHYRWLEAVSFGGRLQACRTALLDRVGGCGRALVVGDGDGRFLAELVKANPRVRVDAVDVSAGMTALARQRVAMVKGAAERVRFSVADIRADALPGTGYDLIVTNFLLDCFTSAELAAVVARLSDAAAPDARWVVGDFTVPRGRWQGAVARVLLAGMYAFFRVVTRISAGTLADPAPLLAKHGWRMEAERPLLAGFLASRLWVRG